MMRSLESARGLTRAAGQDSRAGEDRIGLHFNSHQVPAAMGGSSHGRLKDTVSTSAPCG